MPNPNFPPLWSLAPITQGNGSEGTSLTPAQVYERNKAWVKPLYTKFETQLPLGQEMAFRAWVRQNHIPFDPNSKTPDYDMRGFWQALANKDPRAARAVDPNDGKLHFPDTWKTPYDVTFSRESKYADQSAPRWNDQGDLVAPDGRVMWSDKNHLIGKPILSPLFSLAGDQAQSSPSPTISAILGLE